MGRAGYLWLTRPEGWEADPVFADVLDGGSGAGGGTGGRSPGGRRAKQDPSGVGDKLAKARQKADRADEARRRAQEQRDLLGAELAQVRGELADAMERIAALEADRNAAVRTQKAIEADLAETRRDLKVARVAARQAEQELIEHRQGAVGTAPEGSVPRSGRSEIDGEAARRAVAAAVSAAADLAEALNAAGAALALDGSGPDTRRPSRSKTRPRRPATRRAPTLPPGVLDDSPQARRHLVADPGLLVVVDGYNLAREAWSGLVPEEERRRTVALLEEAAVRAGSSVTVVFDGDDSAVAPAASRVVRVCFSATGVTADDEIADLVASTPADQPVLVVSSDRAVVAEAKANGAVTLSSAEYLAAVGR